MATTQRISKVFAILTLVVVVIVSLSLIVLAVAPMAYSGLIERYVRSSAGIDLSFQGIDVLLSPLQIGIDGLVLRNPDPAYEEPLLEADRVFFDISVRRYRAGEPTWWRGSAGGVNVRYEREVDGKTNWDLAAAEPSEPAGANPLLQFHTVRVDQLALLLRIEQEPHRVDVAHLDVERDDLRLIVDLEGRYLDEPLEAIGALALPDPERANAVAFRAKALGGEIHVEGILGHDGQRPGDVQFRACFDDLTPLGVLLGQDLDVLEPVAIEGHLRAPERGRWQINAAGRLAGQPLDLVGVVTLPGPQRRGEVKFDAQAFGGEIRLDGAVPDDGLAPGQAKFRVAFDDLSGVGALLGQDLARFAPMDVKGHVEAPEPGRWQLAAQGRMAGHPMEVAGALRNQGDLYELERLEFGFGDTVLEALGKVHLGEQRVQGQLRSTRLRVDELRALVEEVALDQPPGEGTAEPKKLHEMVAALPLSLMEDWVIDLRMEVQSLEWADGTAQGLDLEISRRETAVSFDFGVDALDMSSDAVGDMQLVRPLRVEGRIIGRSDQRRLPGLEVRFATAGIEGEVDAQLPFEEADRLELTLDGRLDSTDAVRGLELGAFETLLPVVAEFEAHFDQSVWRVEPMRLTLAEQPIDGRMLVDVAATPMRIRGDLHSPDLDLNALFDVAGEQVEHAADEGKLDEVGTKDLLSDEPVDWGWLRAADLDVRARVERMALRPGTFRDLTVRVRMSDGELLVDPIKAALAAGGLDGRMRVREAPDDSDDSDDSAQEASAQEASAQEASAPEAMAQARGVEANLRLLAKGLAPADMGVEEEMIRGGASDLFLDLRMRGLSTRELANSVSGEMAVEIRRAVVDNEMINVLGADVVAEAIRYLLPFTEREPRTELRCAAAHVVATDGMLFSDDHVVLDTDQVTVRASGAVNLRDASLEIDFRPEPTEGLDLGIADIADLVRVRGSLADPQVELNPEGVAGAVLSLGAAIATAGASLVVQGMFQGEDGTPCRQIFAAQPEDHAALENSGD